MTHRMLKKPYNVSHLTMGQKGYQSKNLVKSTNLRLVKNIVLIILDLLKSTCPQKLRGFFNLCHFGVLFGLKNLKF
jgi:hypothetical protein